MTKATEYQAPNSAAGAIQAYIEACGTTDKTLKMLPMSGVLEWLDYSSRVIIVDGIDDESAIQIMGMIQRYNREDDIMGTPKELRQPIKLFILSPGGDAISALNLVDTIQYSDTPIFGFAYQAYSAGGIIFLACHKKFCYPNSTFLLHDGYSAMSNTASKNKDTMEFYGKVEDRIKKIVLDTTKITEDEFDKNYSKDWYFFADEMLEYGIADSIVTCLPFSLKADKL